LSNKKINIFQHIHRHFL